MCVWGGLGSLSLHNTSPLLTEHLWRASVSKYHSGYKNKVMVHHLFTGLQRRVWQRESVPGLAGSIHLSRGNPSPVSIPHQQLGNRWALNKQWAIFVSVSLTWGVARNRHVARQLQTHNKLGGPGHNWRAWAGHSGARKKNQSHNRGGDKWLLWFIKHVNWKSTSAPRHIHYLGTEP